MDDTEYEFPSTAATALLATLQPVRDLAQNFDIDIAAHLDEYLEQLLDVLHQDDAAGSARDVLAQDYQSSESNASLDFAKAALLVQNSSQVYSRKVDYFHTLVMNSLEGLQQHNTASQINQRRGASSRRSAGSSIEDQAFFDLLRDPDWDFLPLDDVMPVASLEDITRTHRGSRARYSTGSTLSLADRLSLSRRSSARFSLSQGPAQHSSSVLLEEGDDSDETRSSWGRGLPHRAPPAYHTLNLVGNKCDMTPGGALLLPGVYQSTSSLMGEIGSLSPARSLRRGRQSRSSFGGVGDGVRWSGGVGQSIALKPIVADGDDREDDGGFPLMDTDDYHHGGDDDGPGFSFPPPDSSAQPLEGTQPQTLSGSMRNKKAVRFASTATLPDPWELLDPHTPQGTYRPLRKGRTLALPIGVTELPSDCVTGARTKRIPKRPTPPKACNASKGSLSVALFRHIRHGTDLPDVPLSGLVFGDEFHYLLKRRQNKKEAGRRRARNLENEQNGEIDSDRGFGAMDGGDEDDYDDDYGNEGVGPLWEDDPDSNNPDNTGNAGLTTTVDEVFQGDECEGLTFEELCGAHIQKFAKGAETYANETNLLARVRLWQEKVRPLLEEEEKRETFDIHKYGQVVISSMQAELDTLRELSDVGVSNNEDTAICHDKSPRSVSFEAIARRFPKYDVPRLFLAALSLCNSGNIVMDHNLNIELLSPEVLQPMETYLAPSIRDQQN